MDAGKVERYPGRLAAIASRRRLVTSAMSLVIGAGRSTGNASGLACRSTATVGLTPASTPFVVAHNAGDDPDSLAAALENGADVIEIDVGLRDGRLIAAHRPPLVEVLTHTEEAEVEVLLAEAVSAASSAGAIQLDLKSIGDTAIRLLVEYLTIDAPVGQILVSAPSVRVLRALQRHAPKACRYLTISDPITLRLLLDGRLEAGILDGISARESLLDERTVAALHEFGIRVLAWTVDDLERAATLMGWGVDGITTGNAGLITRYGRHGDAANQICR